MKVSETAYDSTSTLRKNVKGYMPDPKYKINILKFSNCNRHKSEIEKELQSLK